ncbi:23S rRNA (cytidine(2498)-2'-O)-methyltransferase RlmM [Kushneria aurantia]|uniref:Ribosomal RNA large subunit methyltransferase M n=1 Tax=Kushneria aurantia TaxID=504092 RepID=A0ABV6G3R9_9GAMM|nr:23S rRNA (cytidine(2498)-2'-O)-methyltransferase RlmM [Kushneria aurantia]
MSQATPNELLLYCRAGFEADMAAEVGEKAALAGHVGYPLAVANTGFVRFILTDGSPANTLHRALPFESLVFARQSLVAFAPLEALDRSDRISAIVSQVEKSGWSFEQTLHEVPDTNEGKSLSALGRSLNVPLESACRKRGALRRKAGKRWLHLFWSAGDRVQLAISFPGNRSDHPGGIHHLRAPREAPSRSTLKLEEAWHTFIPRQQWDELLADNLWAADLGAAPGGWTWQLVRRGLSVYAIDNGPMQEALMASGLVEHLREDAYDWSPPHPLDWLVCDMVDRPSRVTELMAHWLVRGWSQRAIFNLKLPMKQRWQEVSNCLALLETRLGAAGRQTHIRCRHLYHDREEVTVYVASVD